MHLDRLIHFRQKVVGVTLKEYITGVKVKIIEIIFLFACLHVECAQ